MDNWQLFVAAGLPTVTVLVAMWRSDKRMDGLDKRIDGFDKRIDGLDARMDRFEAKVDKRFDHLEGRMDRLSDGLHEIHLMLGRHDARLDNLEKK